MLDIVMIAAMGLIYLKVALYLLGYVAAYAIIAHWKISYTHCPMDGEDRVFAMFFACFSWGIIAMALVVYFLKLLEPKAETKEEE